MLEQQASKSQTGHEVPLKVWVSSTQAWSSDNHLQTIIQLTGTTNEESFVPWKPCCTCTGVSAQVLYADEDQVHSSYVRRTAAHWAGQLTAGQWFRASPEPLLPSAEGGNGPHS